MIYRNAYTGAVIRSDCVIQGNGWEPVDANPADQPKAQRADEEAGEQPSAGESGKKPASSRRKGK